MAQGDGSVVFTIDADDKKAQKKFEQIKKAIQRLEEDTAVKTIKKSRLEQELANAGVAADKAKIKLEQMKTAGASDDALKDQETQVKALDKAFAKAATAVEKIDEALKENADSMIVLKEEAAQYEKRLIGVASAAERAAQYQKEQEAAAAQESKPIGEQVDDAFQQIAKLDEAITRVKERVAELKQSIGTGLKGILVAPIQLLALALKKMPSLIKGAFFAGKKIIVTFGKSVIKAASNLNVFRNAANAIAPAMTRLGKLITGTFVFNVVSAGLQSLRETMSSFLAQNAALTLAMNRTKAALTTAFMPIYEAVVPALTTLFNVLTQVIGAIAQFNAMLFGKTAKAAQSNAKALTKQAAATKAAGGAAEDASKSLASFDEINQLADSSSGGGGGGGGGDGGTAVELAGFDLEFDEQEFDSWGEAFSNAIDKIAEKVKKLPEVFSTVADKINEFFGNLLEMFTFPGVQEKVAQLGVDLADALNKLVQDIDWETIGAALGAGLQLAISFLVGFIYEFNWQELGGKIGELINGLVSQINWYDFGRLLWGGFKIAIEFLAGLLLKLDMKKLAESASNIAKGFFDSMTETIKGIDWHEIGRQIATFLENIDWAGIAESLFTAIGTGLGALASFFVGLFEDAVAAIRGFFTEKAAEFEEMGGDVAYGWLYGIEQALVAIGTWVYEHILKPFVQAVKDAFKIGSPSKVMEDQGGFVADGLLEGIKNTFSGIKNWIKEHVFDPIWNGIKSVFGIEGDDASKMAEIGEAISNGLSNGIRGGIDAIKTVFNTIIETVEKALNWIVDKVNSISFTTPDWVPGVGGKTLGFKVPHISIPRLAAGAVIPPNREFLAVLGDQRSGNNIEAPENLIRQIVRDENNQLAAQLQQIIALMQSGRTLDVDGRAFAQLAYEGVNSKRSQYGGSLINVRGG